MSVNTSVDPAGKPSKHANQNIQVYTRVRPLNGRERAMRSIEVVDVISNKEIVTRQTLESKVTKKFTFDRTFGPNSKQVEVYATVVAPLIEEVLAGYNCTVFAYGQTGTGKTHTMVGTECAELKTSWEDDSDIGIIPRALSHLFDELRLLELEFSMRISYLELYNEELCDLLSSDDSVKIRIFDDSAKKGSVIVQGLEEISVHSKDEVFKLLEKGKERRRTATTLMNAQSSRSHTVFSILVHIRENGIDGEEMLKIGKLNLVDLAGSENITKAGNEKAVRMRETVNINQSLLTLGRVITALVERTPHVPYRESKLTRLLQESLGGRTKTSIIATISPGHKDIEETLSTLEYAHRAKNIQNKPEVNQKLTKKTVLKEYTEEIDKLKRDLMAARDKNGIYLAEDTYIELTSKMESQVKELNEKMLLLKALKDDMLNKDKLLTDLGQTLTERDDQLRSVKDDLAAVQTDLSATKTVLSTTNRRYKEKKVLLQSHVRTEQKLSREAHTLLNVADMAVDHTQRLHNNIDRRKQLDAEVQSATSRFSNQMIVHLGSMEDRSGLMKNNHILCTDMLAEELAKTLYAETELHNAVTKEMKKLQELFVNDFRQIFSIIEHFGDECRDFNNEHGKMMSEMCDELEDKQNIFVINFKTGLDSLNASFKEHIAQVEQTQTAMLNEQNKRNDELKNHILEQQKIIHTLMCSNGKQKVRIDNQQSLLQRQTEEMAVLDELINKLDSFKESRKQAIAQMHDEIKPLQNDLSVNSIEMHTLSAKMADLVLTIDKETAVAEKSIISRTMLQKDNLSQDASACKKLKTHIDDYAACTKDSILDVYFCYEQQACKQNHGFHNYKEKIFEKHNEQEMILRQQCEEFNSTVTEENKQITEQLTLIGSYNSGLQNLICDYDSANKMKLKEVFNAIDSYNRDNTKQYAPTGVTPVKCSFEYPRSLSKTSPHANIIARFRQQSDWAELDTSAGIDDWPHTDESEQSQLMLANRENCQVTPDRHHERQLKSIAIDNVDSCNVNKKRGTKLSEYSATDRHALGKKFDTSLQNSQSQLSSDEKENQN